MHEKQRQTLARGNETCKVKDTHRQSATAEKQLRVA